MEKIKEMIDEGALELATTNGDKHEAMKYDDLKQKVDFRNQAASISKSISNLSNQQRKKWIDERRSEASNEFSQGNYDSAIKIYLDSLVGIDFSIPNIKQEYQYPVLLSMATCYYHQGQYQRGVAICQAVLKERDSHPMANFKKGCLLIKLGEYDKARTSFERAKVEADEKLSKSIGIQLNLLKKYKKTESNIYKNMFVKEKEESTEQDQETIQFIEYAKEPIPSTSSPPKSFLQFLFSHLCPRRPTKQQ